jgi:catechol 2,3-dioxygenase-like lactoylglutathione lyase family enzyme
MFAYVTLGSNDLARSRAFYDAALKPLNIVCRFADGDELGYGPDPEPQTGRKNLLYILSPYNKLPATWGNGALLAFDAPSRAAVDAFYRAAMDAGGFDEGAPGLRPYHPTFYAAYVRDPDGNKLSAVYEGPA